MGIQEIMFLSDGIKSRLLKAQISITRKLLVICCFGLAYILVQRNFQLVLELQFNPFTMATGQILWRILLICIPPVMQSKPARYGHRSVHWMAHGYKAGVVGRRLGLHLRYPWLAPYGLNVTLEEHQLLMSQ